MLARCLLMMQATKKPSKAPSLTIDWHRLLFARIVWRANQVFPSLEFDE